MSLAGNTKGLVDYDGESDEEVEDEDKKRENSDAVRANKTMELKDAEEGNATYVGEFHSQLLVLLLSSRQLTWSFIPLFPPLHPPSSYRFCTVINKQTVCQTNYTGRI